MNRKVEQLASSIHRAVQEVIARGLHDPRVSGLITVTGVRINPETKEAFVGVSVLPEEKQELTLHGLRAASRHVRREVGELVRTRQMPTIVFTLDESLKKQAAVMRAINQAAEEREKTAAERGESGGTAGGQDAGAGGGDADGEPAEGTR